MEYAITGKDGKLRKYEVSYSQVLQRQTNKLLMAMIILLLVLLLVLAYVLIKIDLLDIPTRLISAAQV